MKRTAETVPYKKNSDGSDSRVASFENPGFDSARGLETRDCGPHQDPPAVLLSAFEEGDEFNAASNPMYTGVALQKLLFEDLNTRNPEIGSESSKDVFHKCDNGEPRNEPPVEHLGKVSVLTLDDQGNLCSVTEV